MSKIILSTDIDDADIINLRIGDIVYLSGTLVTARDAVHDRLLREGCDLPFSLAGKALLHAGPIMRSLLTGHLKLFLLGRRPVWDGSVEVEFIARTGLLVIGKGGRARRQLRLVEISSPSPFFRGLRVLAATHVEKVESGLA